MDMDSESSNHGYLGIEVDVPGVLPETKLSELTVRQFVEVLIQVSQQLMMARIRGNPDVTGPAMDEIRSILSQRSGERRSHISEIVRETQSAILDRMPELLREANARTPSGNSPENIESDERR